MQTKKKAAAGPAKPLRGRVTLRAQAGPPSRTPLAPDTRATQTRAAILRAASREFAQEGVAGARTDAIARAARVNKALLYYYFRDKETLYGAALEQVFAELSQRLAAVLEQGGGPRETMLAYAGAYFDYIASNPDYPRLVHQEMTRAGRTGSPHLKRIAERYMMPLFARLARVFEEGRRHGEFREVAVEQFLPSMIAVVVFYFVGAPMLRLMLGGDPLAPERVAARRVAVLDFIAAALFRPEVRA
jgi:TetR/AcrR family transcriptional regulator